MKRMAVEEGVSANAIAVAAMKRAVEVWRKAEKGRLVKRLDELNQGKLV